MACQAGFGYPLSIFPTPPNESLLCVWCERVLREPLQTPCAHRMCKECFELRGRMSDSSKVIRCPACDSELQPSTVFPDKFAEREANSLTTVCPNARNGCPWTGELRQHMKHIGSCTYIKEREDHRIINPVMFENREPIPVKLITEIVNSRKCPFDFAGCTFEGDAKSQHEHLEKMLVNHIDAVKAVVVDMRKKQLEVTDALEKAIALRESVPKLSNKVNLQEALIQKLIQKIDGLRRDRDKMQEMVKSLERDGLPSPNEMMRVEQQLRDMQLALAEQGKRAPPGDENDKDDTATIPGEATHVLARLEAESTRQNITLANLNLRLCLLESTTYDGILLWRIDSLQTRMDEAVGGRVPSLFSPPFYTHRFGYRVCARIYLNGDGIGKSSYVSLFIVVMKGQYDDILQWPFRRRITFTLNNYEANSKDVERTFQTDPDSSSFQQPDQDMNVASGCPCFVDRKLLMDPSNSKKVNPASPYVSNGSLLVRLAVT